MRFPLLSDRGLENLCIALSQIKTADGLFINLPIRECFTPAILEQMPRGIVDGYVGMCGNALDRERWRPPPITEKEKPIVVCLCGSTRFKSVFDEATYLETMAGRIVLSVGFFMHATGNRHGESIGATPEQKVALDELHKRKIDLSDEILVLNVAGYIGESTRSEINYARAHNKFIRYLEPPDQEKKS